MKEFSILHVRTANNLPPDKLMVWLMGESHFGSLSLKPRLVEMANKLSSTDREKILSTF